MEDGNFQTAPGVCGLEDWEAGIAWFCTKQAELISKVETGFPSRLIPLYFQKKYGESGIFHLRRLTAAMAYLERHMEEFDTGEIAIVGREEAAIGRSLIRARCHVYARCPDDHVLDDFPVELVRGFAEKMKMN